MSAAVRMAALLSGLLFGLAMVLSGMVDPRRVLAFLDVTRDWDPTLAFVMLGAIAVAAPAFVVAQRRGRTLIEGTPIVLPPRSPITLQLLAGATLFGLGWGLSGLCPGPVLVGASSGSVGALVFVAAMTVGMRLSARLLQPRFSAKGG